MLYLKLHNGHDDGKDGEEQPFKGEADEENDVDGRRLGHHQTRLWVSVRDAASCENGKVHWADECQIQKKWSF